MAKTKGSSASEAAAGTTAVRPDRLAGRRGAAGKLQGRGRRWTVPRPLIMAVTDVRAAIAGLVQAAVAARGMRAPHPTAHTHNHA